MSAELIISVSGLRGIVGESLTPAVAARYTTAFLLESPPGPIVVARDGRANGPPLAAAVRDAIHAAGRTCLDADVAATPTVGVLVREHRAAGGVQISASHNPAPYNGLKLFSPEGRVIPSAAGARVLDRYRQGQDPTASPAGGMAAPAAHRALEDTTSAHWSLIAQVVDVERIRQRGFRVLLDANHGAGSVLGERVLAELACDTVSIGNTPDGAFAHPPEPTSDNLAGVCQYVTDHGAAVGFCQDPDADRLALIDEQGRYIGEEYTLALAVAHVLRNQQGAIVTNCSTSRMSQDLAEQHGVAFYRSAVGEANVVDMMLDKHALLGGEGNGGIIDPRVGLVRDSFAGMALVLDAMASRQQPLSHLVAELPRYAIHKSKMDCDAHQLEQGRAALREHFAAARYDDLDGMRFDWPDKWLLVRGSNTEPIVRLVAEAASDEDARELCQAAAAVMRPR